MKRKIIAVLCIVFWIFSLALAEMHMKALRSLMNEKLTGVFAVVGSELWTYGDHMLNAVLF